jgi:hypothetical protein
MNCNIFDNARTEQQRLAGCHIQLVKPAHSPFNKKLKEASMRHVCTRYIHLCNVLPQKFNICDENTFVVCIFCFFFFCLSESSLYGSSENLSFI